MGTFLVSIHAVLQQLSSLNKNKSDNNENVKTKLRTFTPIEQRTNNIQNK